MSAPQIQPQRSTSDYSSSEEDDRKSAHLSDDKVEGQPTPIRVLGEDGEYVHEEGERAPIGAVGLPWSKKGPALAMILLFVCE